MRLVEKYLDAVNKALIARNGQKDSKRAPRVAGGQKATEHLHSEIASLPERLLQPIQDMDPDSNTFGEFYFMIGYDDIGGTAPLGRPQYHPVEAGDEDEVAGVFDEIDRLDVFGILDVV